MRDTVVLLVLCLSGSAALHAQAPASAERATPDTPAHAATPTASAASGDLLRAYQRELAVLVAEQRELEERLSELALESAERRQAAEADIRAAEDALVAVTLRADRSEARLADLERDVSTVAEGDDALAGVLSQAARDTGREAPAAVSAAALQEAFTSSLAQVGKLSALRRRSGTWFDLAGREVSGTLLEVGAVAAFAKSGAASGALAPAGAGALKVWHESDVATARALVDGDFPETVGLFLFESTDTAVEPKKEKTLADVLSAGGVIGWVIVGLGLFALLLVLVRAALLALRGRGAAWLAREVPTLVLQRQIEAARALCRQNPGSMARVLDAALHARAKSREERADCVDERILSELVVIDRFGAMILVIASVAPLLGLLGTVTGMIATFEAITELGTGDPRLLSGGISEALITTELGLIVAIPSLLLGNLLSGVGERLKRRLDAGALRVANALDDVVDKPEEPASLGIQLEHIDAQLLDRRALTTSKVSNKRQVS